MKKHLFAVLFLVIFAACNTEQAKYGQGGRNACQFFKEQVPELREDIEKIEVIEEDSLLSDRMLSLGEFQFSQTSLEFWQGNITQEEFQQFIDSTKNAIYDVQGSWLSGTEFNDSLHQLDKYKNNWRKVYKVLVTMKSGTTQESRVLMEADGIIPCMLEKDLEYKLQEYNDKVMQAQQDIYEKSR